MIQPSRLAVLVLLAASIALSWLPGRAQEPDDDARFAFADTTLLRDTLDLRFTRLFPLADSLRVPPDSLRAWSVRWRLPLERLVAVADSLRVPPDSVGPILDRERFNPLAAGIQNVRSLRYTSTYDIQRSVTTWTNEGDLNVVQGAMTVRGTTTISQQRQKIAGVIERYENRRANTEIGWKVWRDLSLGARIGLDRFLDTSARTGEDQSVDDFQFSARSRQRPSRGVTSELNLLTGFLDVARVSEVKRGLSGNLNGKINWNDQRWITHDLNGTLSGNLARTGLPGVEERASTRDWTGNLSGALALFTRAPVGFKLNYKGTRSNVATPIESSDTLVTPTDTTVTPVLRIQRNTIESAGVDAALRWRVDPDRELGVTGRYGTSDRLVSTTRNARTNQRDLGFGADGRWELLGFELDSRFNAAWTVNRSPDRGPTGGYGDSSRTARIDVQVTRNVGRRIQLKGSADASLTASRTFLIGTYPNPPVDRDLYRQGWRLESIYTRSDRFSTGLVLDVDRNLGINLAASSAASNSETRTYRAEWRWTYRILPSLTASQRNALIADYIFYRTGNRNRLNMDYTSFTTLNAVLTPRFTIDLTHNGRYVPSGGYTRDPDGLDYLERSDLNEAYTLSARFNYAPSPAFSLSLQPEYFSDVRSSNSDGTLEPVNDRRTFNLSGGAIVNLSVGRRARLNGNLYRRLNTSRTTTWTAGEERVSPRAELDSWSGNLILTVTL